MKESTKSKIKAAAAAGATYYQEKKRSEDMLSQLDVQRGMGRPQLHWFIKMGYGIVIVLGVIMLVMVLIMSLLLNACSM